jgi:hypothetical protein
MTDRAELPRTGDPLSEALASQLSPTIMSRLREVAERSRLTYAEILSQAIDFAWHVEMSDELSGAYNASNTQRGATPVNNGRKTPAVMPAEGSERPLAEVELGDIVLLKKPYNPSRRAGDRQAGPFPLGIVAEIIQVLPDGRTRNASLYLYDPERREIFLGPNSIPEYVDFHCSELALYKRASEQGYIPLVPKHQWVNPMHAPKLAALLEACTVGLVDAEGSNSLPEALEQLARELRDATPSPGWSDWLDQKAKELREALPEEL